MSFLERESIGCGSPPRISQLSAGHPHLFRRHRPAGINKVFGKSGKDNYEFDDGGWLELAAGPTLITLDKATAYAQFHGLILTTDASLSPVKPLTAGVYPAAKLYPLTIENGRTGPGGRSTIERGHAAGHVGQ